MRCQAHSACAYKKGRNQKNAARINVPDGDGDGSSENAQGGVSWRVASFLLILASESQFPASQSPLKLLNTCFLAAHTFDSNFQNFTGAYASIFPLRRIICNQTPLFFDLDVKNRSSNFKHVILKVRFNSKYYFNDTVNIPVIDHTH